MPGQKHLACRFQSVILAHANTDVSLGKSDPAVSANALPYLPVDLGPPNPPLLLGLFKVCPRPCKCAGPWSSPLIFHQHYVHCSMTMLFPIHLMPSDSSQWILVVLRFSKHRLTVHNIQDMFYCWIYPVDIWAIHGKGDLKMKYRRR